MITGTEFNREVAVKIEQLCQRFERPLPYAATESTELAVDAERGQAAFILFEQVDRDPAWSGNQYRYSLWKIESGKDPECVHEDHAYEREGNPEIKNLRFEDGSARVVGRKGELHFQF